MKSYLSIIVLSCCILVVSSCKKDKSCEGCKGNNQPPIAVAGTDQVITLPTDSVSLNGSASTDPDGSISDWLWTKISGPASFAIGNATTAETKVKNLHVGIYKFELKVTDNIGLSATDTVQVIVDAVTTSNHPPVANAGNDTIITLPAISILLNGSASYDPDNNITNYSWTKVSGPTTVSILNANAIQTEANNLYLGVYQFELKVTDAGGLISKDTMQATVNQIAPSCNVSGRPQVNAQLIPIGFLSQSRYDIAVATAGNKIIYAGGLIPAGGGVSSRVDIFDITTNTWTTAELSEARNNITTAVLGNKIFFAGGGTYTTPGNAPTSNRVDIYDVSTNTWTTASLSEPRSFMAGAAAGNKVLFAGGSNDGLGSSMESEKVDIYNASTNTWTTGNLANRGGYATLGISTSVYDDKIYFAGSGAHWFAWDFGGGYSSTINIYDASTGTWSLSNLNEERGPVGALAVGNKNYWAGGYNWNFGNNSMLPLSIVEIRDMNTGISSFGCLFQPNSGMAVVQKNSDIVFFTAHTTQGYWMPNGIITNKFDIYNTNTNAWSIGVLPVDIYNSSVVSVSNTVYVAGGFVNGGLSAQAWKLQY